MTKVHAIQGIDMLLSEVSTIRTLDQTHPAFLEWRTTARNVLAQAFGESASYCSDFERLQFVNPPELAARAKRAAMRIIKRDEHNTTHLGDASLPVSEATSAYFQKRVDEAAELLRFAKRDLQRS